MAVLGRGSLSCCLAARGGQGPGVPSRVVRGSIRAARGLLRSGRYGCIAALLVWAVSAAYAEESQYSEYEVKAAFLYNFAKFVEWPEESLPKADTPIVIGVLGQDPFKAILDETIRGKQAQKRDVEVKRSAKAQDMRSCHIVFISVSERSRLPETLGAFKGSPVLTVSDIDGFAEQGGIVNLTKDKGKIRLRINVAAAKRAKLKMSSQLLKLAKIVKDPQDEESQ